MNFCFKYCKYKPHKSYDNEINQMILPLCWCVALVSATHNLLHLNPKVYLLYGLSYPKAPSSTCFLCSPTWLLAKFPNNFFRATIILLAALIKAFLRFDSNYYLAGVLNYFILKIMDWPMLHEKFKTWLFIYGVTSLKLIFWLNCVLLFYCMLYGY